MDRLTDDFDDLTDNNWVAVDELGRGRYFITFTDEGLELLRSAQAGVIKDFDDEVRNHVAVYNIFLEALSYVDWEQELYSAGYYSDMRNW